MEEKQEINGWAIIELMGHAKCAGYVTTAIIGTSGMLRVDVPKEDGMPAYTRFYGPGAVYSLTMVTEALARAALRSIRPPAVTVYIPGQLPEPESVGLDLDADEYNNAHMAYEEDAIDD